MSTTEVIDFHHARDISDERFLQAVDATLTLTWSNRWRVAQNLAGYDADDPESPYDVPGVPQKVIIAKAKRLISRGLLGGCTCGCRGDFEVTAAGYALLGDANRKARE